MPLASSPAWLRQVEIIRKLCEHWLAYNHDIEPIRREIEIIDKAISKSEGKKKRR